MPGRSTAKQGRESIGLRIVTSPWTVLPSAARARITGAGRSVAVKVLLAIVVEVLLATAVRILFAVAVGILLIVAVRVLLTVAVGVLLAVAVGIPLAVAVGGCLLGARGVRGQKFLDARLDLDAGRAIELQSLVLLHGILAMEQTHCFAQRRFVLGLQLRDESRGCHDSHAPPSPLYERFALVQRRGDVADQKPE